MATRVGGRKGQKPAPTTPEARVSLGRYRLLMPIASGGMGEVWVAEQSGDLGFRRLVAIKMIRGNFANEAAMRKMFLDEARLASRIHHANVIETIDLGEEQGLVYQVMDLVDGSPFSALLDRTSGAQRIEIGVATRVIGDALRGLHAAHELRDDDGHALQLIHRDVSPQNILIGTDGVARLADFGIAKSFGRSSDESVVGDVKGKINYMAPEQVFGLAPTRRTDLFSVGVVLWEALAGEPLFTCPNSDAGVVARRKTEARSLRAIAPDVPAAIADVVARALVKRPEERFASALEMGDALEEAVRASSIESATHQDVARCLDERLGAVLGRRREAIRAARQGHTPGTAGSGMRTVAAPGDAGADDDTHTLVKPRPDAGTAPYTLLSAPASESGVDPTALTVRLEDVESAVPLPPSAEGGLGRAVAYALLGVLAAAVIIVLLATVVPLRQASTPAATPAVPAVRVEVPPAESLPLPTPAASSPALPLPALPPDEPAPGPVATEAAGITSTTSPASSARVLGAAPPRVRGGVIRPKATSPTTSPPVSSEAPVKPKPRFESPYP